MNKSILKTWSENEQNNQMDHTLSCEKLVDFLETCGMGSWIRS